MEQARYWMWATEGKHGLSSSSSLLNSTNPSYGGDSWEEQAFAEDATGHLGGCIWPPRSYTCSFCRREFRSAQALGGHMNVHRKDRARLKHSPNPHNEIFLQHQTQPHHCNHKQNMNLNPSTSLAVQYSSKISTFVYNSNSYTKHGDLASASSPPRVAIAGVQVKCFDGKYPIIPLSSPTSCSSNDVADKQFSILNSSNNDEKNPQVIESDSRDKMDLWAGLNLVVCRSHQTSSSGTYKEEGMNMISCKRRKFDATLHHKSEIVVELCTSQTEDLDLELRLGQRPQVK